MTYTKAQMVLLRRMLRRKRTRERREGRTQLQRDRIVGRVFCWRCRMPLSCCTCPLSDMELWYTGG